MSPHTMSDLFEHMSKCETPTRTMIFAEIDKHGPNKASNPFSTTYADGEWWVYIEVDCADGTFEIETHNASEFVALNTALTRLRREFTTRAA